MVMQQATFAAMGEALSRDFPKGEAVTFDDISPRKTWFGSVCEKIKQADYRGVGEETRQGSGKLTGWLFRSDMDGLANSSASNIFGQLGSIFCQEFVKGISEGMQKGMTRMLPSRAAQPDTGAKILDQMLAAQAHRTGVRL